MSKNGYEELLHQLNIINTGLDTIQDTLKELLEEQFTAYFQAFMEHDEQTLSKLLKQNKKTKKRFMNILQSYSDQNILRLNQYVTTYHIFDKILQNKSKEVFFADEICEICKIHNRAEEILFYLYEHPHAQHKIIVEEIGIPKSSLSELMDIFEKIQCIQKRRVSKYTFYSLTVEGEAYIKERKPSSIIPEIIDGIEYTIRDEKRKQELLDCSEDDELWFDKKVYKKWDIKNDLCETYTDKKISHALYGV